MINMLNYTKEKMECHRGFTLVEMAVVLVIVGIMLGGLMIPLSAQMDQRNYTETKKNLEEVKEALIGFSVLNGRLPCPSTEVDPTNINYGEEDVSCNIAPVAEGFLPWKTLGVAEVDAWGSKRRTSADPWTGYWRYRVNRNFSDAASLFTMLTPTNTLDSLMVQNSAGATLTSSTERPIAIFFSVGKNLVPDGHNASFEVTNGIYESNELSATFDDVVIWLSRPLLMNRMVAAGKLP